LVWEVTEVESDDGEIHHELSGYDVLEWPEDNILEEGWGIAHMSGHSEHDVVLFATDGSDTISLIVAHNWTTTHTVSVTDHDGNPIDNLNELELIDDHPDREIKNHLARYIFANVWQENCIYMISLETGRVVAKWDFEELVTK